LVGFNTIEYDLVKTIGRGIGLLFWAALYTLLQDVSIVYYVDVRFQDILTAVCALGGLFITGHSFRAKRPIVHRTTNTHPDTHYTHAQKEKTIK